MLACRKDAAAFEVALDEPAEAQEAVLRRILGENAATEFGRKAGFDEIRTAGEFAERVPLCDYADVEPYVDRILKGERGILTGEPVERLVPSSGSVAARKLIPFTAGLRRAFHHGIAPWVHDLYRRDPDLMWGPSYWAISPALEESPNEGSVPIGFEDDSEYLGVWSRLLVRQALAVPPEVRRLSDVDLFRRVTLLHLLCARELRLVSVWHPSFLALLCAFLEEQWDPLMRALEDGDAMRVGPELRTDLAKADPSMPETIWPRLRCISCWADGQSSGAAEELKRLFPNVRIDPKGLVATEAFVSVPYKGARPLAIRSHYFEFVDSTGRVSGAEELREGETYSVVVTTQGGLYRYRMHDLVTVEGFVERTPSIAFVGREDRVSDHRGEKLSEGFVASALAKTFDDEDGMPEFVMLAPESVGTALRYALFVSSERDLADGLAELLDNELSANPHYDWARKLGQLGPIALVPVAHGAHRAVVEQLARRGQHLGGIKASCLRSDTGWREILPVVAPAAPHD